MVAVSPPYMRNLSKEYNTELLALSLCMVACRHCYVVRDFAVGFVFVNSQSRTVMIHIEKMQDEQFPR